MTTLSDKLRHTPIISLPEMAEHKVAFKSACKRISIALLSIFISALAFASNKNLDKDITMVSYDQRSIDIEGSLSLKNNSSEEVKNIVFLITYLDMSDNELDYEEFARSVSIAPGKTKKINIPAYEYNRNYHYYKSEGYNTAFKVKFQLKDYNVDDKYTDPSHRRYDDNRSEWEDALVPIILIVLILFAIGVTVGAYILVAVMAHKRNRSAVLWIIASLMATPILIIIILLVIGKDNGSHNDIKFS